MGGDGEFSLYWPNNWPTTRSGPDRLVRKKLSEAYYSFLHILSTRMISVKSFGERVSRFMIQSLRITLKFKL